MPVTSVSGGLSDKPIHAKVYGRLFQEQAEFLIANATEIEHSQAWKTAYIDTLKGAKTKGLKALGLGESLSGRAFPCG